MLDITISLFMINPLILHIMLWILQILTYAKNALHKIACNVRIAVVLHVTLANKDIL